MRDREESDPRGLSATSRVLVNLTDVNDVSITGVVLANNAMPTAGGGRVIVRGTNFGSVWGDPSLVLDVRYRCDGTQPVNATTGAVNPSACVYAAYNCSVTRPNTEITCNFPEGSGSGHLWRVSVSGAATLSSLSRATDENVQATTYLPPSITSVAAPLLSTRGGQVVNITGANFGPAGTPASATYGGGRFNAGRCVVASHTFMTCISAEGVGVGHTWVVTVDGQTSAPSAATTSYLPPTLSGLAPLPLGQGVYNLSSLALLRTAGGDTLELTGSNFGPVTTIPGSTLTQAALLASTLPIAEVSNGRACLIALCRVVVAHTTMHCVTQPGVGVGYAWAVRVGGQYSGISAVRTAYHPPRLTRVYGDGAFGSPTEGGPKLLVAGQFFGRGALDGDVAPVRCAVHDVVHEPMYPLEVAFGRLLPDNTTLRREFRAVDCAVETTDVLLGCLMGPGTGKDHHWRVGVDGQWTDLLPTSTFYSPPFVTQLDGGPAAIAAKTQGGEWLMVNGSNFGDDISVVTRVSYGPTGVEFNLTGCTMLTPHSSMNCTTSRGVGINLGFSIVVDELVSLAPKTTYNPPRITSIPNLLAGYSTRVSGGLHGARAPCAVRRAPCAAVLRARHFWYLRWWLACVHAWKRRCCVLSPSPPPTPHLAGGACVSSG